MKTLLNATRLREEEKNRRKSLIRMCQAMNKIYTDADELISGPNSNPISGVDGGLVSLLSSSVLFGLGTLPIRTRHILVNLFQI